MLLFIAGLLVATVLSSIWCAVDVVPPRVRGWWSGGRHVTTAAVVVAVAVAVGAVLRFVWVPAHHAMYLDEPWYAEAACNLGRLGRLVLCEETWSGALCTPYGKAWGWPVAMAPWTLLFGCDTLTGVGLNRLLGTATILLVALAARCAGARWWQCAIVAAVLAIHPIHVAWSATGETNVAAAAALLAGLCGAILYLRAQRLSGAALAVFGLGWSTALRPESMAPALVSAAVLALAVRPTRRSLAVAAAIGIACLAAAATASQLWSMNQSISGGAFLSLRNVAANLRDAARVTPSVHLPVLLLAVGGAVVIARSELREVAWLLLGAGLSAAVAVLAYDRFHERMLLSATVALLPLSGFVLARPRVDGPTRRMWLAPTVGAAVVCVLGLLWEQALVSAGTPPETQIVETRIASRIGRLALPAGSLIVAQQPTVLAAAGIAPVMATQRALADEARLQALLRGGQPVYFLRDMYCEPDFEGGGGAAACDRVLERFSAAAVAEERLHRRAYTLYRLSLVPAAPLPALKGVNSTREPRQATAGS
jgi:hypothetical protein